MNILPSNFQWILFRPFFNLLLISILIFLTSFSSDYVRLSKIRHKLESFDANYSREKVYLHFDKPYYSSGDDIWFKVYLVDGNTLLPNSLSKIVYVDLINTNNEIIDSRVIKIENGGGKGEFKLDINLNSGEYKIRAYTNFMKNFDNEYFFRKKFQLISLTTEINKLENLSSKKSDIEISNNPILNLKPDVQFLPEGGNMINYFMNRIGFKSLGTNGKGIDISGTIVDNYGNKIIPFKTSKFGLGWLKFIPEKGKIYKARINYLGQHYYYDLPKAMDKGIAMTVNEINDNCKISIQSSLSEGVNNLTLIGQQKGILVCEAKIKGSKRKAMVNISKSILKEGLLQFTLLDENQTPLCERLVFVENDENQIEVNVIPSKDSYQKRELVEIDLSLNKSLEKTIHSDMSLSITDVSVVNKDKYGLDIKSYLLLDSDLKGEIEHPGYYFTSDDPQRKKNLDILLMCQGWRKFLLKNEPDSLIKYEQEEGIIIHGTVKNFNNRKKTAIAEVRLLYKNREQMFFNTVETNNRGYFNFGYYDMNDSTSIIIMAKGVRIKKGKKQIRYKTPNTDYFIEMDSVIPPKVTFSSNSSENFNKTYFTDYFERSKVIHHEDSVWAYEGGFVQLEEVKLKSVRRIKQEDYDRKKKTLGVLYFEPSNRLDFNDLGYDPVGNVFNVLQGRIPGLTIRGRNVTIRSAVSITQSNKPLYLLNNIPVDYAAIESVAAHNVHFVDVLKGYRAAIYGSRGSNGVIAVYTKDGTERSIKSDPAKRKGIISFIHPGYNHAREFYDPVYKTEKPEHKRPDYRSTLCWKPNIKLDSNGKTKISFYAADIPTTYRVELQGITSDGVPITSEAYINIE